MAHIWACPPSEGDDYIFHCHPAEQKIPKHKRLVEWYRKMLDKAIMDRVVIEYKVMFLSCKQGHCMWGSKVIYSRPLSLTMVSYSLIIRLKRKFKLKLVCCMRPIKTKQ